MVIYRPDGPLAARARGSTNRQAAIPGWPPPIGAEARIGLVGDFLDLVEPQTEADPAALLLTLLAYVGSAVGRAPHFLADGARHGANLFAVVVADTSRGRKGTSEAHVRALMHAAEPDWCARIAGGLSSGEGLIQHVRDPRRVGHDRQGQPIQDQGREDHRLLAREPELARVLTAMRRDGNTLSMTLRAAWDGDTLRVLTRGDPISATDAHVSLLGHVTAQELKTRLADSDVFGGLGNRVLWCCARRQRELPFGGQVDSDALGGLARRLRSVLDRARRGARCFEMTSDAMAAWPAMYSRLTADVPGMLGVVLARSEAQVRRLALVYAILDGADVVDLPHLLAGAEVMRYCADSARMIFGTASGDRLLDRIIGELRGRAPEWVSREDLRRTLGNHATAEAIAQRLASLLQQVRVESQRVEGRGRPREEWRWVAGASAT